MENLDFNALGLYSVRWIHYVAGVCWIGLLYFLNLVNVPVQGKLDAGVKKVLTPEQYHILREKGTDYPGTGKYYLHKDKGMYVCAACGNELFTSDMKFESNCGWPSFDKEIAGGKIKQIVDKSHGMTRIEIVCAKCDGHLGHIFDDGPTITGQRYCVNSTSIDFKKGKTD